MPYSGPSDPDLPSNVTKKSPEQRAQWVAIFNSVYEKTGDDGESMRQANGATKERSVTRIISADKSGRVLSSTNAKAIQDALDQLRAVLKKAGIDDAAAEMQVKEFAVKCGYEVESYPQPESAYPAAKPYGGATTFAEVQAYADAQEQSEDLSELTWKFQAVYQNIMADEDMTPAERAAAITQAASDFAEQAQDPEASDDDEGDKSAGGIMRRVKSLFSGEKDWTKWNEEHRTGGEGPRTGMHEHALGKGSQLRHSHAGDSGLAHSHGSIVPDRTGAVATIKPPNDSVSESKNPIGNAIYGSKESDMEIIGRKTVTKTEGGKDGFTLADYADTPDDTSPSTWKLRLSDSPGHHDVTHVAGAITALQPGGFRGNEAQLGDRKSAVISKISGAINKLDAPDDTKSNLRERLSAVKEVDDGEDRGAFASFKDVTGRWRWAATWSNNFYDRDGEVFPESAHKDYEAYVDGTHDYPELQLWHIPGSKSGVADMIAYDDGMCLATGTWDEDKADIAAAFSRAKDLGVSHGYTYAPRDVVNGAYRHYRTFEISPLPRKKAANIGTDFTAFAAKEEAPMLTAEKREWLVKTIGEERAKAIEENNRRMRKELADRGIAFKDFVEALAEGVDAPDPPIDAVKAAEAVAAKAAADAEKAAGSPEPLYAPGFKSVDGGKMWAPVTAEEAVKAFGGNKAPPFGKDGKPVDEEDKTDQGADDAEENADGTKKKPAAKDANPAAAIVTAVKEANAPIIAEIKAIRDEFTTKIDAIKTGRDDVIATAWATKNWGRDVKSATDSSGNLVDPEKAKAALDALGGEGTTGGDPALPYVRDLMALISSGAGLQQS